MPESLFSQSRKRKTKAPCQGCFLHLDRCICNLIFPLETQTRLSLIIHAKELKRTTNTGRLAIKALSNSQMIVRGLKDSVTDLSAYLDQNFTPLFLFPSEEATPLTEEFIKEIKKPIQLIVPDGNWRQASKVSGRHQELKHIKRVFISKPNTAKHHLRKETTPEGMATLEAIAECFKLIEGDLAHQHLRRIFEAKLQNTLVGRGQLRNNVNILKP